MMPYCTFLFWIFIGMILVIFQSKTWLFPLKPMEEGLALLTVFLVNIENIVSQQQTDQEFVLHFELLLTFFVRHVSNRCTIVQYFFYNPFFLIFLCRFYMPYFFTFYICSNILNWGFNISKYPFIISKVNFDVQTREATRICEDWHGHPYFLHEKSSSQQNWLWFRTSMYDFIFKIYI